MFGFFYDQRISKDGDNASCSMFNGKFGKLWKIFLCKACVKV